VAKRASKEIDERQRWEEIRAVLGETKGRVGGAEGAAARLGMKRTTFAGSDEEAGHRSQALLLTSANSRLVAWKSSRCVTVEHKEPARAPRFT
jgi:hypothetical protein